MNEYKNNFLINAVLIIVASLVVFSIAYFGVSEPGVDELSLFFLATIGITFFLYCLAMSAEIVEKNNWYIASFVFSYLSLIPAALTILVINTADPGDFGVGYLMFFIVWPILGLLVLISWVLFLIGFFRKPIGEPTASENMTPQETTLPNGIKAIIGLDIIVVVPLLLLFGAQIFRLLVYPSNGQYLLEIVLGGLGSVLAIWAIIAFYKRRDVGRVIQSILAVIPLILAWKMGLIIFVPIALLEISIICYIWISSKVKEILIN